MLRHRGFAWGIFSITFFRTQFGLSLASGALLALIVLALASIVGGQLVNRFGRKRLLVTTLVASSPFLALLPFVPNIWIALAISWSGSFIYAIDFPASVNLTLEQAPESRGTMMSMSSIFVTFGLGIGTALGGVALALFNYTGLIFTFVALSLIAAATYLFLTDDPCRI